MDGYQHSNAYAETSGSVAPGEHRSFLFLQGPISTFFDRLGRGLIARGHRVHRINLHFGDQLFWRLPAIHFRGRFEDWREFVGDMMDRHQITDLVLHGDRRPYHIVAAEEARARGIPVIATDLGYVRPDWITLEYDGMTTYSRFPRDAAAISTLAAEFPEADLRPRFRTPFWMIAALDIAYNLGLVFGWVFYPNYRYHSICHPFAEYAGWIWSRGKRLLTARVAAAAKRRLQSAPGSYFLVPLQLATDYQIRAHSPFRDAREAVRQIIASFAASGSRRELVFIAHPLDNGLIAWNRVATRWAREYGIAARVLALPGGTPTELLCNAAGVVTINSTIGVTALQHGVPVKVLGNAVFDIAGLTCQEPLDAFWHEPVPPDPALMCDFLRALVGTTQVKGGYYERRSQDCAIAGFIERFERRPYPLPQLTAADFAARPPRLPARTVVVAGISGGIGLALARTHAAPGIRLCLVGPDAATLDRAAEDCRHRGALVETFCPADGDGAALGDFLAKVDERWPIDGLLVQADSAEEPGAASGGGTKIGAALDLIATLAEPMRRRGYGEVVVLSSLCGRSAPADAAAALHARKKLLGHAAQLRRRLQADGVAVTAVVPGRFALHAAARLYEPRLARVSPDRIGAAIAAGLRRHREVIAVPGIATAGLRAVGSLWARCREAAGNAVLPPVKAIGEAADEVSVPGKTGTGD